VYAIVYMLRSGRPGAPAAFAPPPAASRNGSNVLSRFFMVSESGFFDSASMALACREFEKVWQLHHPGLACLCIWDQCGIHRVRDVLKPGLENNVYYFSSLANASHIIAILDGLPFAVYKTQLKLIFNEDMFAAVLCGDVTGAQCALLVAAFAAEDKAFSKIVLTRGFFDRGLVPFDEEKQRQLVKEAVGLTRRAHSGVEAIAVLAAGAVIRAVQAAVKTPKRMVKLAPRTVYSPGEIVALIDSQEAAKLAKKESTKAKEEVKQANMVARAAAKEDSKASRKRKEAAVTFFFFFFAILLFLNSPRLRVTLPDGAGAVRER
jgi:hypothetical protein